jgi:hypothetical protein
MEPDVVAVLRAAAERGLPSLVIGGVAVILSGDTRSTSDLDLLVPEDKRPEWLDLMRELDFRVFHGTEAFVQLEAGPGGGAPVDLMFVDKATWTTLIDRARVVDLGGEPVLLPRPQSLVALKLHSAGSATRSKPALDWEDIRQIVRICGLDPEGCGLVDQVPSSKSETSKPFEAPLSCELNLPVFTEPQREHPSSTMTWSEAVRYFEPLRLYYMKHFYSPEQRLRDKNPKRFVMH